MKTITFTTEELEHCYYILSRDLEKVSRLTEGGLYTKKEVETLWNKVDTLRDKFRATPAEVTKTQTL